MMDALFYFLNSLSFLSSYYPLLFIGLISQFSLVYIALVFLPFFYIIF